MITRLKSFFKNRYKGFFDNISDYWKAYGGLKALLGSPYLHISFVISALLWPIWLENSNWFSIAIAVMPNMMAFSLGTIALLMAFGDEKYREILANAGKEVAPFVQMSATFIHFILMQFIALLIALFLQAYHIPPFGWFVSAISSLGIDFEWVSKFARVSLWYLGFTAFCYALTCSIAAAFWVFRNTILFTKYMRNKREEGSQDQQNK